MNTTTTTKEISSNDLLDYIQTETEPYAVEADGWVDCLTIVRENTWAFDDGQTVTMLFGEAPEGWGEANTCECDSHKDLRAARNEA